MKPTPCLAVLLALLCATPLPAAAQSPEPTGVELKRLFDEDQAERQPTEGKPPDWLAVMLRDETRQQRVKALLAAGSLQSGADHYHAAMVLQHSMEVDDFLLAHDLCVVAVSKGESRARWLAAASLDRFLVGIGRPQRFGTQSFTNHPSRPPKLRPVDATVPDSLRRALDVPTLDEARAKERQMAEFYKTQKTKD